jgi:hypothetical protein
MEELASYHGDDAGQQASDGEEPDGPGAGGRTSAGPLVRGDVGELGVLLGHG